MKAKLLHFISISLCALLSALPAVALDVSSVKQGAPVKHGRVWEQRSEFSAPVKEGARLVLRANGGAVTVNATESDKVTCVVILRAYTSDAAGARNLFDKFQLSARSVDAGGVYLTSQSPRQERHGASLQVQFLVTVPQRFNVDVETQGGDISLASPLNGGAWLTTAGGDVHTSDVSGSARIETAGGSIEVGNAGGDLSARTAGGSIRIGDAKGDVVLETSGGEIVTGTVVGSLRAETAGGDLIVGGAGGQLVARTAGGQIQIGPTEASVRAETAGGSIRLKGARGRVVAETAGGSIDLLQVEGAVRATTADGHILAELNCVRKNCGPSELETSMGDVFVYLPVGVPLTIDAAIDAATGHRIQSDFPLDIQGNKDDLTSSTVRGHGMLNGGGDVLRIRTVAGNIQIRKIDEASLREVQQQVDSKWKAR